MWAAVRRFFGIPIRSVIFDLVIAGMIAVAAGLMLISPYDGRPDGVLSGPIGLGMAVSLLVRRRWPVPVFVAVGLLGMAQLLAGMSTVTAYDFAVLVALYSVVKYADRMLWAWLSAAGVVAGSAWYGLLGGPRSGSVPGPHWYTLAGMLVAYATPIWLIGLIMRTRRLYVVSLEDRAATAERERDQRARLAVAEERGRIARELHDVVAHSLAVMIVQADGASYAVASDPAATSKAIRTVADTGREALADMRRLVEVLRGDGQQGDDAPIGRAPADPAGADPPAEVNRPGGPDRPGDVDRPGGADRLGVADRPGGPDRLGVADRRSVGLSRLEPLLERFRAAGLRVELDRAGPVRALPGGIELAGYRVVQESLTNTLKHGGVGSQVTVVVNYDTDRVDLSICDDGAGGTRYAGEPLPGGHGLLGMRERVAIYGGDFRAGPRLGAGWQVSASFLLPTAATPR